MVPEPLPRGVQPRAEALPVRVLFEVREKSAGSQEAPGEVLVEASTRPRSVQVSTESCFSVVEDASILRELARCVLCT